MDRFLCGVLLAGVLLAVSLPPVHAQQETFASNKTICTGTAENGTIVLTPSLNATTCNITVDRNSTSGYTTIILSTIVLQGGDNLSIYDGTDQLLNITGSRDSVVVLATSQKAYLVVQITANLSRSLLVATYNTSGCDIEQTVSGSSILESPTYLPNRVDFTCSYRLRPADLYSSLKLALAFIHLALPNATLNITSPSTQSISGTRLPPDVYSDDVIQMELSVPKNPVVQKFWAIASSVSSSPECGQTVVVNTSLTLDLTVPKLDPLHFDCRITLEAATGKSLMLTITSLRLADYGDHLELVDGASLFGTNVLASFTSSTSGHLVLSGENKVLVHLVPGILLTNRSMTIDIKELSTVNHWYDSGNFTVAPSPGSDVVTQYYLLEVMPTSVVKLDLAGETKNKTYNYTVSVYDGDQTSSPLLVTFSSEVRMPVVSSGNKMLLVARLSSVSQPLGVSFSSQAPGCDKITSAPEGTFQLATSPSVPPMCQWTVTAPPQSTGTILLDMTMVELSGNASLSVYSGVVGSGGSLVAHLTSVNSVSSAPLPSVAVPASQWAQVVWSSGNSSNLTSVAVNVHFQLMDTLCGGPITAAQGRLHSPAFPNLYPLNALCQWTFPPSKPGRLLFFDFPRFQLAPNHSVVIAELRNGTSREVGSFNGSAALPDVLFASNVTNTVTFSAQLPQTVAVSNQVAQGFDIQYWTLNCGGFTNKSNGSFTSPGYPSPVPISPANTTLCVWFVQLPNKTGDNLNIVNLTLHVKKTGSPSVTDLVKVYDGNTLRHKLIALNTSQGDTMNVLSRYNTVIVVFNITMKSPAVKADDLTLGLMVNFTTFSCNKTLQCKNGICMHPDWRCNGKDDCGDNSDEQNCIIPPNPPQPSTQTGTKPAIVVLLFFVGLLLGVLLAVIIPRIIRRFRTNRYSTFRDEPVA